MMPTVAYCLILVMAGEPGTWMPLQPGYHTEQSCAKHGKSLTDGRTVKRFHCLPAVIVGTKGDCNPGESKR